VRLNGDGGGGCQSLRGTPEPGLSVEDREYDLPYIFQTSQRERCSYQLCDKFADFKRHGIGITAWFGGLAGSSGREPY
jgi:hypothetical protein